MSQVVICQDSLSPKRKESLEQEKAIDTAHGLSQWQGSDATKTLMVERLIAVLFAPVVLFWILLLFFAGVALAVSLFTFKCLSKMTAILKNIVKKQAG